MKDKKIPNDKRHLPYGSAFSILDTDTVKFLNNIDINYAVLDDETLQEKFLTKYLEWIKSNNLNTFKSLDDFKFRNYSNGTSESFDKFYLKHPNKRFRCFKGEYMYHRLAWRNGFSWAYIEDDDIKANDAVVISLPFANTGDKHKKYDEIMTQCSELGVPVLVDCAYFGICKDIDFDLSYDCIKEIAFSLSKTFPVSHVRIGMRLSKIDDDDTLFVYHKIKYTNRLGAHIGLKFLENFSPDYIVNKYQNLQQDFCSKLDVIPSKTVLFGIGGDEWSDYNRGGVENRLSFHRQFVKGL